MINVSGGGVTTTEGIEVNNGGRLALVAIQSGGLLYVAALYDAKSGASPAGTAGSASLDVTCNGSPCTIGEVVLQVDESDSGDSSEDNIIMTAGEIDLVWSASFEDGFVLGPINAGSAACFDHDTISAGITSAVYIEPLLGGGGFTVIPVASGGSELLEPICVNF